MGPDGDNGCSARSIVTVNAPTAPNRDGCAIAEGQEVPRTALYCYALSCCLLLSHLVTQLGCTHGAGRQGDRCVPPGHPWMPAARGLGAAEPGGSARGTPIAPAQGARGRRPAGDRVTRAGLSPKGDYVLAEVFSDEPKIDERHNITIRSPYISRALADQFLTKVWARIPEDRKDNEAVAHWLNEQVVGQWLRGSKTRQPA